jgi:diacylglycerol kinase
MSKYKASNIFVSFGFAIRGLLLALRSQRNFRADLIIGAGVIIAALMLKLSTVEIAILTLAIGFTLFAELINTVIEFVVDAYFGNKYSILAKIAKDISAASVFISATTSAIIGILLLLPKIIALF